jgi:type I restriction enzyme, S subunit
LTGHLLVQHAVADSATDGSRSKHFRDAGVPLIRGSNLSLDVGTRLLDNEIVYLSEDKANELRRSQAVRGDLVFTCWGTVGQVGFLDKRVRYDRYIVSNKQMKLTPDLSKVHPLYLYYALSSPAAVAAVRSIAIGSSVPGFNLGQLRHIIVPLPTIPEQRAIAEVLGALDDKIEANNKSLQTIMGLTRTTWRRHAAGATRVSLSHVVRVGLSGVWGEESPTEKASAEVFCLRGRDIEDLTARAQPAPPRRWLSQKQLESRVGADTEIWTAGSGSLGPTLLVTQQLRSGFSLPLVYSNFVKRLTPCAGMEGFLPSAWFAVLDAWEAGEFSAFTTGTAMPNLDASALLGSVMVPALEEAAALDLSNWCDLALDPALLNENERLAALRDALLPPLLSGDLRVGDAEALVGDAV